MSLANPFIRWAAGLAVVSILSIIGSTSAAATPEDEMRPGDLVVTFDRAMPRAEFGRLIAELEGRSDVTVAATFESALVGLAGNFSDAARVELERNPWVVAIEPDITVDLPLYPGGVPPSDPVPSGPDRVDQRDLRLDGEFAASLTGAGVQVYVIDSGIRVTHEAFGGRADGVFTAVGEPADEDCADHGTGVAGLAAGKHLGIASGASVHSVRFIGCGHAFRLSHAIQALEWVATNHRSPAVANFSAGTPVFGWALREAARGLVARGVPLVVAAGNNRDDEYGDACGFSPGDAHELITVGASSTGVVDSYETYSLAGPCVDLVAVGDTFVASNASDSATEFGLGTSLSAPLVTGVVALMLEADPSLTPAEVESLLEASATSGRLTGLPAGTPDRLLYAFFPQPHGARPWRVGDFNGDGRDDLLREAAGRGAGVLLSDGTRFVANGYWTDLDGGSSGFLVGDFTGDGKDDIARVPTGSNRVEVLMARPGFFLPLGTWLPSTSGGTQGFKVGDFTGDGRADLLRVVSIAGRSRTEVFRSTGSSFVLSGVWLREGSLIDDWYVGDFNGDGKDDILSARRLAVGAHVERSDGAVFLDAGDWAYDER